VQHGSTHQIVKDGVQAGVGALKALDAGAGTTGEGGQIRMKGANVPGLDVQVSGGFLESGAVHVGQFKESSREGARLTCLEMDFSRVAGEELPDIFFGPLGE
jgi:hypothetical protein